MEPFTLAWAAEQMQAEIVGHAEGLIESVCIDSRKAGPGALFFALVGEHTDGHQYVAQALAARCIGAVVSHPLEDAVGPQLVVSDPLVALGDLARSYRSQFDLPVVGITGSVGKTSTKEMVAAVLRTSYHVLANERNYNNEIGVPLTVFGLNRTHTAAVIEMGMRARGEIDRLAEIAQPTIGVVTNIGHTHIEILGTQQNIAEAKAELLQRLPETGLAIMPQTGRFAGLLRSRLPVGCGLLTTEIACVSHADIDVSPDSIRTNSRGATSFEVRVTDNPDRLPVSLSVVGAHHVENAMLALAVASALAVPIPAAVEALQSWRGAEGRMAIRHTADGLTILDDCYNAAPESMRAALATLCTLKARGGVAILGDMRELGSYAPKIHEEAGAEALTPNLRLLVTIGALAARIADVVERVPQQANVVRYATTEECAAHIRELVEPGDTILVKGSRALEMEKIVAALTGEENVSSHA